MPPAYDPIRDMRSEPGTSASPPLPSAAHPHLAAHRDQRISPHHSRNRVPSASISADSMSPTTRSAPGAVGPHMLGDGRFHPSREEMAADRYYATEAHRPSQSPQLAAPVRPSPPTLHQQHPHQPPHYLHHPQHHPPPHHPQLQHRPSSSSSSSSLTHEELQQRRLESHRSASIHDLIAASEIASANQVATSASAAAHAGMHPRGPAPSRSLSQQGEDCHDPHLLHRGLATSMSRSASNASQLGLPHRPSSQSQLHATAPQRTERSPSMANLLNDGTAGAVTDRPRSGSQSSISSMLSHSHSHSQLPVAALASSQQQHHTASHYSSPTSAHLHQHHGHETPARDQALVHLHQRPGSSTSAPWAHSPPLSAPSISAAPRTGSSPAMGPAQPGFGASVADRQRILSYPGIAAGGSHPRSLSSSYGHAGSGSVTSSPSGALPPALHPSPSHRFAVPGLPAHRSPEGRRIPLPPSPSSGPIQHPSRTPTTPGSVWPPASGPMGAPFASQEGEGHHHGAATGGSHPGSSPRRGSLVYPPMSRFQPPTPGSLPLTPGGLPPTPGSRSLHMATPGFDPRYAEEYFAKRPSESAEGYNGPGTPSSRAYVVHASAAGALQPGDDPLHATAERRTSSKAMRRSSAEIANSLSKVPTTTLHQPPPLLDTRRGSAAPPPPPHPLPSPSPADPSPSPLSASHPHARRDSLSFAAESARGSIFDPVRGTAIPASRPSSSSSRHGDPSPSLDPRRYSESSIGVRSSTSDLSPSVRRINMDVLPPPMASPSHLEGMGKRRSSVHQEADHDERQGKKAKLSSNGQVADDAGVDGATAQREPEPQSSPTTHGTVSPRTTLERDREAAARVPSEIEAEEPESECKTSPLERLGPEEQADHVVEPVGSPKAEAKPEPRSSPPRFTPPPEHEMEEDEDRRDETSETLNEERADDRRSRRSPSQQPSQPPSPAAAAAAAPAATIVPMRYAPTRRISPPKSVLRPISVEEIDEKRSQCRNPLRREWEREHRTDSREPLDKLLREYHESLCAARSNGNGSAAERKRPREDDLKDALEVADHYNKRREVGVQGREESPIIALRKFNNWVKSVLIGRFTRGRDPRLDGRARPRGGRIMELGCGKGGDLKKWDKVDPTSLVGVDIAQVSIEQAQQRHRDNRSRFAAHFFAFDCFSRPLTEVVPRRLLDEGIDTVSLQFCMHYAFENEDKARTMLDNVSRYLRPGGTFIGTIPDCEVLRQRLYQGRRSSFGNAHYRITFDDASRDFSTYGNRYTFFLEDAVENVPEYVVDWATFVALAAEFGLECLYHANFADIYNQHGRGGRRMGEFGMLAERMKVVDATRGELVMDEEMWHAATLYKGFAFVKV
ncbi:mRNA cap guanine-N7 methyltransferase [Thecaphora frezii]